MAEDYMSDAFLVPEVDVRPGLVRGVGKRKLDLHKRSIRQKQEARETTQKVGAKASLMKGLDTNVITEDNPGYKLMKMMGYKAGTGLGKEGEGRSEPIKINPFADRKSGLGKEAEKLEQSRKRVRLEQARAAAFKRNEASQIRQYRESKSQAAEQKHVTTCVRKCQTICQQMDKLCQYSPPLPWYWPPPNQNEEEEEEEPAYEPEPKEILGPLTSYLRYTHCYCVWCGVKYTDSQDLLKSCPGDTEQLHEESSLAGDLDFAD